MAIYFSTERDVITSLSGLGGGRSVPAVRFSFSSDGVVLR